MKPIKFSSHAWEDYLYWQKQDKRTLKRINSLIQSINREGNSIGIGKPELLKGDLSSFWSRRIDETHRLVYQSTESEIIIVQCRYHYKK